MAGLMRDAEKWHPSSFIRAAKVYETSGQLRGC
jgi:hypothetical protein